ncbi:hypothetical protein [Bythopirellula goksoeyrii]|uniref:Uncharacterized protein n=1 Tax=Bythopirellula goksoeyrii TaxID=1400387 RepID=A0A5B9Q9Z3_9BACT|nr:hypothetical protein [Bythopirellula goksoeyrii]QEG34420.1 hypothetical protein Pr1d_16990 [Bythopirellula goksoeyrii]
MRRLIIARSIGSITLAFGVIGTFDSLQSRDDRLLYEAIPSLMFLGPTLIMIGILLLFLTSKKPKSTTVYKKMLVAGVVLLVIPVGLWIKVALGPPETDAGWGMIAMFVSFLVGGPSLVLVITASVLMSISNH